VSDTLGPEGTTGRSTKAPEEASERRRPRFVRPQAPRNLTPEQRSEERTSTPLELFFDLCFVVALAILGAPLPPAAFVALVTLALLALTVLESIHEDPTSLGGR
jgi:hypothetical protein